jgi:hypothetical protein
LSFRTRRYILQQRANKLALLLNRGERDKGGDRNRLPGAECG